ncbi:urease accessory protein UreF [Aspergillus eucalypticola CBS 122712]|uniref:Urease accessory protein UreF n=1 Tax=Aspergillus eucalypticola (strain CBS 122712 / IBT 29274) TaxID=1448314 RepID=A0A317VWJ2_ASPEC|nr:urease accessory protein UreF [Aspergillus eucalypticola CBS 122712]PWY78663.1 urease accessory protein UreF [Aspergillus eucalypticola CBS 122712]
MTVKTNVQDIEQEIVDLEDCLRNARARLASASASHKGGGQYLPVPEDATGIVPSHALLLLSDSALPLGSFAYSSGLESYLAHNKPLPRSVTPIASFQRFLKLSIASMASTSLPYVLAGYRRPEDLETLDNDLDASTPCIVAQRASLAQGRALLGVWERAFRKTYAFNPFHANPKAAEAVKVVEEFSDILKTSLGTDELGPKGHFAPLWGVVCLAMGMDAHQTAYVFMLNHAKAVLSAAVRASVMGPYQAQNILASKGLQSMITQRIEREWDTPVEDAGQIVPPLDLWVGRHELLYSRIFNS